MENSAITHLYDEVEIIEEPKKIEKIGNRIIVKIKVKDFD